MSDTKARRDALDRVRAWSRRIHGDTNRHRWCMDTARALLDGTELPPLAAYSMRASTGETRRTTITALLGRTTIDNALDEGSTR